ncbi:hypothetical protein MMC26_000799 [Xylographa opegraphella]|nr:hypothetical protein [Xylographa opegraphella]
MPSTKITLSTYAAVPVTTSDMCATPAHADLELQPFDEQEAPPLVSRSLSLEHEVFVAYLKRFLSHKGIVSRLLATFPYLLEAKGCNAHAKLFKKLDAIDIWMGVKGPSEEEVHEHKELFAQLAVIDAWVGNYTSRWAPVQDPTDEVVRGYSWGPALIVEFQ